MLVAGDCFKRLLGNNCVYEVIENDFDNKKIFYGTYWFMPGDEILVIDYSNEDSLVRLVENHKSDCDCVFCKPFQK